MHLMTEYLIYCLKGMSTHADNGHFHKLYVYMFETLLKNKCPVKWFSKTYNCEINILFVLYNFENFIPATTFLKLKKVLEDMGLSPIIDLTKCYCESCRPAVDDLMKRTKIFGIEIDFM
jgi:hypothetical protein